MTPDEQYQQNLALIAQRPGMEHMPAQLQQTPLTNLQLAPGQQGQLYGQVWDVPTQQWVALASYDNPLAEAERDCDALYTRNAKVFTLLGLGLGYFAVALARRLEPWQRLVIWDLDANLFKAMMYAVDLTPLFSHKRIDTYIGGEILNQVEPWWLRLEAQEKLWIIPPFRASYTGVYQKDGYEMLMAKTVDMMRFHAVGLSTWRIFGKAIGDNDLLNMPEYFLNPGYEHLHDLWKDRPAVCLGAGPSLHTNLAQLLPPATRDKVALLSAGTVYALVHGLGLAPDIVTTIDFQRLNWTDQFAQVPLDPACPLVYLHSTYPQTPRRWPGPTFVAENASDTVQWLRQYAEGKKSAAQVQTVAHLNVMVALELGANPIILLGQDLSMPLTAHHAAGARAQDMAPDTAPADAFVTVNDYQGTPVQTRHSFLSMKLVFERLIAENPDRTFLNCSEGGLPLAGAQHMPLAQALALLPEAPDAVSLRTLARDKYLAYTPQMKDTFPAAFETLQTMVQELMTFAEMVPEQVNKAMEIVDPAAAEAAWSTIVAQEAFVQARQPALALFAIRRFDFLELMSRIPPLPEEVPDTLSQAKFNAQRLCAVAQMIYEEGADIQRLLRSVARRLPWLHETTVTSRLTSINRASVRQRYGLAQSLLQGSPSDVLHRTYQRLSGQVLACTQQYEAAIAVLQPWGLAPRKVARMQRLLTRWREDVRTAMPAYFPGHTPAPVSVPAAAGAAFPWYD